MKDIMYPSTSARNAESSGTGQASSSAANINPCFTSFYRWPSVTVERVQSYSTMAQEEGKSSSFRTLVFFPISFFLYRSLPFFLLLLSFLSRHKEGGKERMVGGAHGRRGAQGWLPVSNPTASVVKRPDPLRRSKGPGKLSLPASPAPRTSR
jgi:hypothetical protein